MCRICTWTTGRTVIDEIGNFTNLALVCLLMTDDASERENLRSGDHLSRLLDDYEAFTGQQLDREKYAALKRAVDTDIVPIAQADRSFFVLGSYGDDEEERLRVVEERLDAIGKPFLLKDVEVFEDVLRWTTQFKVLANRATHIVGLYEHSDGGHEWEAGWLDHEPYRGKFTVIKRDYPDLEPRDEPFDGMFAHFLETVDALGQVYRFDASADTSNAEIERGVKTCLNEYKRTLLRKDNHVSETAEEGKE